MTFHQVKNILLWVLCPFLVLNNSCGNKMESNDSSSIAKSIVVSWDANHEAAVNKLGGGYKVYYSTVSDFILSSATVIDVPYVSGTLTPVTVSLPSLAKGEYYVKVVAYSALSGPNSVPAVGNSSGSSGQASDEITFEVQ